MSRPIAQKSFTQNKQTSIQTNAAATQRQHSGNKAVTTVNIERSLSNDPERNKLFFGRLQTVDQPINFQKENFLIIFN